MQIKKNVNNRAYIARKHPKSNNMSYNVGMSHLFSYT